MPAPVASGTTKSNASDLFGLHAVMAKASNPRKAVVGAYQIIVLFDRLLLILVTGSRVMAHASRSLSGTHGGADGIRRKLSSALRFDIATYSCTTSSSWLIPSTETSPMPPCTPR